MKDFETQYRENFGTDLTYDPIKPRPISPGELGSTARKVGRSALDTSGLNTESDDTTGDWQKDIDAMFASMPAPAPAKGETKWSDFPKALASGAVNIASAAVGIPEYAARQAAANPDAPGGEFAKNVVEPLAGARQSLAGVSADIASGMTPEAQDRMSRHMATLDPNKTIWRGGAGEITSSIMLKAANTLPSQLVTILPAALMMRAGMSPGAISYLGASEAGLSVGGVANNIATEIEQAPEQELMQAQRYRQMRETMDEATARQALIAEAQGIAPAVAGAVTGIVSAVSGRYLQPIIIGDAGRGIAGRFAAGAAVEFPQEFTQSGSETFIQNFAAQTYDNARKLSEGVVESAVSGGFIGGLTGGAITAAVGRRPTPEPGPDLPRSPVLSDETVDPAAQQAIVAKQGAPEAPEPAPAQFDPYTGQGELFGRAPTESVPGEMGQARQAQAIGSAEYPYRRPWGPPVEPPPVPPVPQRPQMDQQQGIRWQDNIQPALPIGPGGAPLEPMAASPMQQPGVVQQPSPDQMDMFAAPAAVPDNRLSMVAGRRPPAPPMPTSGAPPVLNEMAADQPSAEPFSDIVAQMGDLADPDNPRLGVYLSADNLRRLRVSGMMDRIPDTGVQIPNFDGKGGLMIARDQATADELANLRAAAPMQEVLGLATGAGTGKPSIGRFVVQQRDENDNVTRESMVADETEAERVAAQWEDEDPSRPAVITTAPQAIRRRFIKADREFLAEENRREIAGARREATRNVRKEVAPVDPEFADRVIDELNTTKADSPERAANELLERTRQTGADVDAEGVVQPNPTQLAMMRAAQKTSPAEMKKMRRLNEEEATSTYTPEEGIEPFTPLSEEAVAALEDDALEKEFRKAANAHVGTASLVYGNVEKRENRAASAAKEVGGSLIRYRPDAVIKNLKGDELDAAISEAMAYKVSKLKGKKTLPTVRSADLKTDTDKRNFLMEVHGDIRDQRLVTFSAVVAANKYPSDKKQFINRVSSRIERQEYGGPEKKRDRMTVAVDTVEEATGGKRSARKDNDKGLLGTTSLTDAGKAKTLKEASAEDKKEFAKRVKEAFDGLKERIPTAENILATMQVAPEFIALAETRDQDGQRTDGAKRVLFARAYMRLLLQLGSAYKEAGFAGRAAGVAEVEKFNKVVDSLRRMAPSALVKHLSDLYSVENTLNVKSAMYQSPVVLKGLNVSEKRAAMTALTNRKLMERVSRLQQIDMRSKDPTWTMGVRDIVYKMTDAIAVDGWMSYTPTEAESALLKAAMKVWRLDSETTKRDVFDPMRKLLRGIGYEFDKKGELVIPTNAEGKYEWSASPTALNLRARRKLELTKAQNANTSDAVMINEAAKEAWTFARSAQAVKDMKDQIDATYRQRDGEALTASQLENLTDLQVVNSAIKTLRDEVSNERTSIPEMVRAEQMFLARMRAGGYVETLEAGVLKVKLPTLSGRVIERELRPVSTQLQSREMTKQEAREILLDLYKEVPLSLEMQKLRGIERAVAGTYRKINKQADAEFTKDMSPEQRRLLEAYRDRGLGLRLDGTSRINDPTLREPAARVADMLESGASDLNTIAAELINALPRDHKYVALARKLRSLNMDFTVAWGDDASVGSDTVGRIWHRKGLILLNRDYLNRHRDEGKDASGLLLHGFLHESVHAATIGALANNFQLKNAMVQLMSISIRELSLRGIDVGKIYGLKDADIKEFVAEAYSNADFQNRLKSVKFESTTLWGKFVETVRKILGLEPEIDNALDAVMSIADQAFTGEQVMTAGREEAAALKLDNFSTSAVGDALDRMRQTNGVVRRLRESSSVLLPMTTMAQIANTYRSHFFTSVGVNPLDSYERAFRQRNADNARSMERATQLSRDWTTLTEQKGPEKMLELSRVMTEATLYNMHPDRGFGAKGNEHLRGSKQRDRHAKLEQRFKNMDKDVRDLYYSVQSFYDTTFDTEVALLTLNALRAYLTRGKNRAMTEREFTAKYSKEELVKEKRFDTAEGLKKEFGDLLDDDAVRTIRSIAAVREHSQGPYFPLMRFGDFVVEASLDVETKTFDSFKEAREYQDARRGDDPTIDVRLSEHGGKWLAKVSEKELVFAESRSEAAKKREELMAKYGKDADISPVQLKQDLFTRDATISSNSALTTILGKLDGNPAAQAAMKNFYLKSLADSSFRKRELSRKNRLGVDYDTQHRTFATYARQSSYYMAQLRYGWRLGDSLAAMQEVAKKHRDESNISSVRLGEVVKEIDTRDRLTTDPQEVATAVRKGVEFSHFMLLTSPSYWMLNATQPWMVTMPWLSARYGFAESTAAMGRAQALVASPLMKAAGESWGGLKAFTGLAAAEKAFSVIDQIEPVLERRGGVRGKDYVDMITQLKRDSIIDLSFVAEIRDIAEGQKYGTYSKVLDASRILSHLTEVNNRVITAVAAYDLARDRGVEHVDAIALAQEAVSVTQFDYSAGNKPRLFTTDGPLGNAGPLVFQFLQYPQHIYAMMIDGVVKATSGNPEQRKVALKTLAGLFTTHLLTAGTVGAMLQPAKWALGMVLAAMGGDDDEPYTLKGILSGDNADRFMRELNSDLFGTELGQVVSKGLPTAIGIDLSQRLSLGQVYMIDLRTDNSTSFLGSLAGSFGGPAVGLFEQGYRGLDYFGKGEWMKGWEAFLPKVGKDVFKAIRYTNEGVTDTRGQVIQNARDLGPSELFMQSIGFAPASTSEVYSRNAARQDAQRLGKDKRQSLINRWVNSDDRDGLIPDIAEFNKKYPARAITRGDLVKAYARRNETQQRLQKFGGNFRGKDQMYGNAYEGDYNVDEE